MAILVLPCRALADDEPLPYTYEARVVRVIDGDTIVFDISLGFDTWIHDKSIRLVGVFAPETRSGTQGEKALGAKVKEFVANLLAPGTVVRITTEKDKTDKYGRYLGTVWSKGVNVNDSIMKFMSESGISKSGKGVKK